jgi:hypothetical protein
MQGELQMLHTQPPVSGQTRLLGLACCSPDLPVAGSVTQSSFMNTHGHSYIQIACDELDWQLSSLAQICGYVSPLLSCVETLDICAESPSPSVLQDMDATQ